MDSFSGMNHSLKLKRTSFLMQIFLSLVGALCKALNLLKSFTAQNVGKLRTIGFKVTGKYLPAHNKANQSRNEYLVCSERPSLHCPCAFS